MSNVPIGSSGIGQLEASLHIKTGGRDVIKSGTVLTGDGKSLEFQLAHLRIVFSFASDGGAPRMEAVSASNASLNLTLYNFNNRLGQARLHH